MRHQILWKSCSCNGVESNFQGNSLPNLGEQSSFFGELLSFAGARECICGKCLHFFRMATPQKEWSTLPEATELELLKILIDPQLKDQPFFTLCDRDKETFGEKNSNRRRRVKNRRDYLKRNPHILLQKVQELGHSLSSPSPPLPPIPDTPTSSNSVCHSTTPFQFESPGITSPVVSAKMSDDPPLIETTSEHVLNLMEPWKNAVINIMPIIGERAKFDSAFVCLRIDLYIPIMDVVDFYEGRYRVMLSEDYTTIEILIPAIAGFLYRKSNLITKLEEGEYKDQVMETKHKEISTKFATDPQTKVKKNQSLLRHLMKIKLPNGATANNSKFNTGMEGTNELNMRIRRANVRCTVKLPDPFDKSKQKDQQIDQSHFFGVVSFWVDGTKVQVDEDSARRREVDQLAGIFAKGANINFEE